MPSSYRTAVELESGSLALICVDIWLNGIGVDLAG